MRQGRTIDLVRTAADLLCQLKRSIDQSGLDSGGERARAQIVGIRGRGFEATLENRPRRTEVAHIAVRISHGQLQSARVPSCQTQLLQTALDRQSDLQHCLARHGCEPVRSKPHDLHFGGLGVRELAFRLAAVLAHRGGAKS